MWEKSVTKYWDRKFTSSVVSKKNWNTNEDKGTSQWYVYCTNCSWHKGMPRDKLTSSSEEIKPVPLSIVELCLVEGICDYEKWMNSQWQVYEMTTLFMDKKSSSILHVCDHIREADNQTENTSVCCNTKEETRNIYLGDVRAAVFFLFYDLLEKIFITICHLKFNLNLVKYYTKTCRALKRSKDMFCGLTKSNHISVPQHMAFSNLIACVYCFVFVLVCVQLWNGRMDVQKQIK